MVVLIVLLRLQRLVGPFVQHEVLVISPAGAAKRFRPMADLFPSLLGSSP